METSYQKWIYFIDYLGRDVIEFDAATFLVKGTQSNEAYWAQH